MSPTPLEIVVASGKGGTGKTFISSNLLYYLKHILSRHVVGVDADAEAPDLALALGGYRTISKTEELYESRKATIDYTNCTLCLNCLNYCKFRAIELQDGIPKIIEEYCEGCGACSLVCPTGAISFRETLTGKVIVGETAAGITVVTSDLEISGRNTGHLVYLARETAKSLRPDVIVIDAAPGIGCPVISSITGASHLIIIVEPTPQSLQGALRLAKLAEILNTAYSVIINKADLNREFIKEIYRKFEGKIVGEIPYSEEIVKSYVEMRPVLQYEDSTLSKILIPIFEKILTEVKI